MSGLKKEDIVKQVLVNTGDLDERGYEKWKCTYCDSSIKRKPNSGWTNLLSHIQSRHASSLDEIRQSASTSLATGQTLITTSFVGIVSDQAVQIAKHLDWVVMDDHSFNFVEKPRTRQYSNIGQISRNALVKYMVLLAEKVKKIVSKLLPSTFGLVIDGWTLESEHYMGIFAAYTEKDTATFRLLSCMVQDDIGDEETYVEDTEDGEKIFGLNAEDQYDHIFRVLQEYGYTEEQLESMEDIVEFITGDNCSTNKSMCKRANIPFMGCKSHLLNLDVQDFIGPEAKTGRKRKADEEASQKRQLIGRVDKLMGKMLTIKNAATLRQAGCTEKACRKNVTRWSSIFVMLEKFLRLYPYICNGDFPADVKRMIPSHDDLEEIGRLREKMGKLQRATKALQTKGLQLFQARAITDALREHFVEEDFNHLDPAYAKMGEYSRNFHFEQGVLKLQLGHNLSRAEREAVQIFQMDNEPAEEPAPSSDGFDVEAVLAGATRQAAASTRSRYKPTKHVSPTGNMCECLFSVCKHTMTDYRRHMGPEKLEATLILRCNYDLWQGPIGQKLIQEIMNEEKAARKAAADQARNTAVAAAAVAAVAADDELDEFSLSGITDDTEY